MLLRNPVVALSFTYSLFHSISQLCFLLFSESWFFPDKERPSPCAKRRQLPVLPFVYIVRRDAQTKGDLIFPTWFKCMLCTNLGGQASCYTMKGRQCSDLLLNVKMNNSPLHSIRGLLSTLTLTEMYTAVFPFPGNFCTKKPPGQNHNYTLSN